MVGNTAARFPKQTCHIQLMLHGTNISSLVRKKKNNTHTHTLASGLPSTSRGICMDSKTVFYVQRGA